MNSAASRSLDSLYPHAAFALPVNTSLPAPRLAAPPPECTNEGNYRDYYGPNVRAEYLVDGCDDRLAIVDKAWPHTLHDVMLLAASDCERRTSVADTPDPLLAAMLTAAMTYADLVSARETASAFRLDGGQLTIGWNHDRTLDRDNGQWWDKTMHWHLNLYQARERAAVRPVRLGDIADTTVRRSLVDPVAYLAQHVVRDALTRAALPEGCRLLPISPRRDATGLLPVGLKVKLSGWPFLASPECQRLLRTLHSAAESSYRQVREAFTGSAAATPPWTRPHLLPAGQVEERLAAMPWLSPVSRSLLLRLRQVLRDVTNRELALMRERPALANRCLTLADLSYNITLLSPIPVGPTFSTRSVYLVMQFKLFSYIGHAPAVGRAVASIIDRHTGPVMDDALVARRRAFQDTYISRLNEALPALSPCPEANR